MIVVVILVVDRFGRMSKLIIMIIIVHDTRIAQIFVITHIIVMPTNIRPLFGPILLLSITFPINIS